MARHPFAGTADDYVQENGTPLPGRTDDLSAVLVTGRAWTAQTGGTQITDLQTIAGSAITGGLLVPDQFGYIPQFKGPDAVSQLWLDFGTTRGRFLINTTDLPARVGDVETAVATYGALPGDVDDLNARLTTDETTITGHTTSISSHTTTLASHTTTLASHTSTLTAYDGRLDDLEVGGPGATITGHPPATAVVYSSQFRNSRPATDAANFSWTCTGTGDQTAINAAIAAVAAQGGGKVQLLGNSFTVSDSIIMKTGVSVVGEGYGTEIKPSADFQDGVFVLSALTDHATYLGHMTINCAGREVHGVSYTNTTNQVFSTPIPDTNPDTMHVIEHIYINNPGSATWAGHGMVIEGSGSRAGRYSNIRILSPSGCGLWQKGSVDSHFHMIEIGGAGGGGPTPSISSTAPVGHGFYISQGDSCMYTSCKAWYSRGAGFYVRATRTAFSSCVGQDNYGPAFWCAFAKNTYSSCQADSNGQGKATGVYSTFPAVGFYVTSDTNSFSSCASFDRGGQSWKQQYGWQVNGNGSPTTGAHDCYIQGVVYSNELGAITGTAGANTDIDLRGQ